MRVRSLAERSESWLIWRRGVSGLLAQRRSSHPPVWPGSLQSQPGGGVQSAAEERLRLRPRELHLQAQPGYQWRQWRSPGLRHDPPGHSAAASALCRPSGRSQRDLPAAHLDRKFWAPGTRNIFIHSHLFIPSHDGRLKRMRLHFAIYLLKKIIIIPPVTLWRFQLSVCARREQDANHPFPPGVPTESLDWGRRGLGLPGHPLPRPGQGAELPPAWTDGCHLLPGQDTDQDQARDLLLLPHLAVQHLEPLDHLQPRHGLQSAQDRPGGTQGDSVGADSRAD